jgi:hypothetical protein
MESPRKAVSSKRVSQETPQGDLRSKQISCRLYCERSEVPVTEKGKRKVVKLIEIVAKQLVTKAATGNIQSQRLLYRLLQQAQERAGEEQNSPNKRDYGSMSVEDLTDGELTWLIKNSPEYAALRDI